MAGDPSDAVHAYFGAMNARRLEDAVELFEDDAQFDAGPLFQRPYSGIAAIRELFQIYLRSLPELSVFVRDVFASGYQVLATVDIRALTGDNPDPDHIATWEPGRKVGWRGAFLFDVGQSSKIRRVQFFGDRANTRKLPPTMAP